MAESLTGNSPEVLAPVGARETSRHECASEVQMRRLWCLATLAKALNLTPQ